MIQWGNYQVPSDIYNAAVSAGERYGKDDAEAQTITGALLGIGKYESNWNNNAQAITPNEQSYGWLQFNRQGGFGAPYSVEQLSDPQLEADVAAEHIARNLRNGVSLFDALWPWTNTRERGLALFGSVIGTTPVDSGNGGESHSPPSTSNPSPSFSGLVPNQTPTQDSGGFSFPNPFAGIEAVGKFFADIENNAKRLAASGVAVVLIAGGILVMVKGVKGKIT